MAVEFDEQVALPSRPVSRTRPSLLTGLILKSGLVKTETGAAFVLGGILVVLVLMTLFLHTRNSVKVEPPTPDQYLVP
jgi:hypothetical protein